MALIIAFLTIISTLLGGLFAIRFKDKLHLILGFSAGAVIGVAFFDLLPESIELTSETYSLEMVTILIAIGFITYLIIDRFFSIHLHTEDCCENHANRGTLGAIAFIIHSFVDGLAVGLAFKVSPAIGYVLAAAVLAHNFSDGINTVNMIFKNQGSNRKAIIYLILDALAPALGVVSAIFISISEPILGLVLALFTGSFLYIGASELIPESHHNHPTIWTTIMTIVGITILFIVVKLAV